MTRVREPTPLGLLLRERRKARRVSWKRLSAKVGVEPETMMMWERGVTRDPPIGKVLLFAEEVGISLRELAEAALAAHSATGAGAGVDQLRREAEALRRRVDALAESARGGGDSPSDEDEPQSDQAG